MKIALIDFCETIVDHQTFDPFIEYVLQHERQTRYRLICTSFVKMFCRLLTWVFSKLGRNVYVYKNLIVAQMKGVPQKKVEMLAESYYTECLQPHLIPKTLELLRELKTQGCELVIVSGGCNLYIKYFAKAFCVNHIMSAELEFVKNICTGRLKTDCMGSEKPVRVREWMTGEGLSGKCAVGVSDSISDMPMLSMCDRKIVISRREHQSWVTDEMEEVIWE